MIRQFCILLVMVAGLVSLENADARNVILDWDASASPNATGYNVYYGSSSGNYPNKLDAGAATSVTVSNLSCGATYYFVATAYDAAGNESGYSAEVSFIAPGKLNLTRGASSDSPMLLSFPVEPGHWYEVQATTNLQDWNSIWQSDVAVSNVWMQFSDSDAGSFSSRFYRLVLH